VRRWGPRWRRRSKEHVGRLPHTRAQYYRSPPASPFPPRAITPRHAPLDVELEDEDVRPLGDDAVDAQDGEGVRLRGGGVHLHRLPDLDHGVLPDREARVHVADACLEEVNVRGRHGLDRGHLARLDVDDGEVRPGLEAGLGERGDDAELVLGGELEGVDVVAGLEARQRVVHPVEAAAVHNHVPALRLDPTHVGARAVRRRGNVHPQAEEERGHGVGWRGGRRRASAPSSSPEPPPTPHRAALKVLGHEAGETAARRARPRLARRRPEADGGQRAPEVEDERVQVYGRDEGEEGDPAAAEGAVAPDNGGGGRGGSDAPDGVAEEGCHARKHVCGGGRARVITSARSKKKCRSANWGIFRAFSCGRRCASASRASLRALSVCRVARAACASSTSPGPRASTTRTVSAGIDTGAGG
jgi:hypothetical protein